MNNKFYAVSAQKLNNVKGWSTLTVTILKRSLVPNDFRNFIYSLSKDWNATAIGMKTHQYLMYGASLEP